MTEENKIETQDTIAQQEEEQLHDEDLDEDEHREAQMNTLGSLPDKKKKEKVNDNPMNQKAKKVP